MKIVEALPTYGVHYYAVKDKQGLPWWLGISYKGGQYDLQDKVKPRKLFQWKQLENLYFREKKFAVEVHDPRRISVAKKNLWAEWPLCADVVCELLSHQVHLGNGN